jgi:hypothetical protein
VRIRLGISTSKAWADGAYRLAGVITAAVLVMIMSPGIGFLYSGLLRRKNALSMIFLSLAIYSVSQQAQIRPGTKTG